MSQEKNEEERRKVILKKIARSRNEQDSSTIWVDCLELQEFPVEILKYPETQNLNLMRNVLVDIHEGLFSKLVKLKTLDLSANKLNTLPSDISRLVNLNSLFLVNNCITELPNSITTLTRLEVLALSGNHLTRIPEAVFELSGLQTLFLNYNRLTYLPRSIVKLKNLIKIGLGFNFLTEIPPFIRELNNLDELFLKCNKIPIFPAELLQMKNLSKLLVTSNPLMIIPKTFYIVSQGTNPCKLSSPIDATNIQNSNSLSASTKGLSFSGTFQAPSLKELAARCLVASNQNLASPLPQELLEYLITTKENRCTMCNKCYNEFYLELLNCQPCGGTTHLPIRYRLCSFGCIQEVLKFIETKEYSLTKLET